MRMKQRASRRASYARNVAHMKTRSVTPGISQTPSCELEFAASAVESSKRSNESSDSSIAIRDGRTEFHTMTTASKSRKPSSVATDRTWYQQRNQLEQVVSAIVLPELLDAGAASLYIVFTSELPFRIHNSLGGAAWEGFGHLVEVREAISDRWRGVGPVVLINDYSFVDMWPDSNREAIKAVLTHEVAHYLTVVPMIARDVTSCVITRDLAREMTHDGYALGTQDRDPRITHNANFIRACLHVAFRMRKHGQPVDLLQVMNWRGLGYRASRDYEARLEDELQSTKGIPISHILATPAPSEFLRKWIDDVTNINRPTGHA